MKYKCKINQAHLFEERFQGSFTRSLTGHFLNLFSEVECIQLGHEAKGQRFLSGELVIQDRFHFLPVTFVEGWVPQVDDDWKLQINHNYGIIRFEFTTGIQQNKSLNVYNETVMSCIQACMVPNTKSLQ